MRRKEKDKDSKETKESKDKDQNKEKSKESKALRAALVQTSGVWGDFAGSSFAALADGEQSINPRYPRWSPVQSCLQTILVGGLEHFLFSH